MSSRGSSSTLNGEMNRVSNVSSVSSFNPISRKSSFASLENKSNTPTMSNYVPMETAVPLIPIKVNSKNEVNNKNKKIDELFNKNLKNMASKDSVGWFSSKKINKNMTMQVRKNVIITLFDIFGITHGEINRYQGSTPLKTIDEIFIQHTKNVNKNVAREKINKLNKVDTKIKDELMKYVENIYKQKRNKKNNEKQHIQITGTVIENQSYVNNKAKKNAATKIQSVFRGGEVRKPKPLTPYAINNKYMMKTNAAKQIQSTFRGGKVRNNYKQKNSAARTIQQGFEMKRTRNELKRAQENNKIKTLGGQVARNAAKLGQKKLENKEKERNKLPLIDPLGVSGNLRTSAGTGPIVTANTSANPIVATVNNKLNLKLAMSLLKGAGDDFAKKKQIEHIINKYTKGYPISQTKYNAILHQIDGMSGNSEARKKELTEMMKSKLRIGTEARSMNMRGMNNMKSMPKVKNNRNNNDSPKIKKVKKMKIIEQKIADLKKKEKVLKHFLKSAKDRKLKKQISKDIKKIKFTIKYYKRFTKKIM